MVKEPKPKGAQAEGQADAAAPRVVVSALQPARWRAGRKFTPAPVEIDTADLTPEEIAALQADPLLAVTVI